MLLVDVHEDGLYDSYLTGCVDFERGNFNKTGGSTLSYPDFTLLSGGKVLGVNAKQAGECLSSLDAVEEQLGREVAGPIDGLHLMIRGMVVPTSLNQCEAVSFDEDGHCHHGRTFAQNYVGYLAWLSRLDEMGVTVVSLPNIKASASYLVALHNGLGKVEHKTFRRLLPTKQIVTEMDPELRAFAKTVMGIEGARWGEEASLAAGQYLQEVELPLTIASLVTRLAPTELQQIPLRSGKRTIGPAAAKRLIEALGW